MLSGRLTWLLTKESNWKGGEMPREAKEAFLELRRRLCQAPVLAFPKKNNMFILATGASAGAGATPGGIGVVLTQMDDQGRERVISYAPRSLRTFLLEQLAATWAIDHYHVYLHGSKFKLLVDNRPMTALSAMHTKTLTAGCSSR